MLIRSLCLSAVVGASLSAPAQAQAPAPSSQVPYSQVPTGTIPGPSQAPGSYERLSGRNNPALNFYGGSATMAYSAPRPRPLPPQRPVNVIPNAKPFTGVQQASAISPYLGLDARETENGLPNYFLYVKPQLDQQRTNQVQQAQYRKLQQQVRTAAAPGVAANPNGGIPTTGNSAQFMNNGGYYPAQTR